jgi:hypothetical protein
MSDAPVLAHELVQEAGVLTHRYLADGFPAWPRPVIPLEAEEYAAHLPSFGATPRGVGSHLAPHPRQLC